MPGPIGNPARQPARIRGSYIPKRGGGANRSTGRSTSKRGRR